MPGVVLLLDISLGQLVNLLDLIFQLFFVDSGPIVEHLDLVLILIQQSLLLLKHLLLLLQLLVCYLNLNSVVLDVFVVASLDLIRLKLPLVYFISQFGVDLGAFILEHVVEVVKSEAGVVDLVDMGFGLGDALDSCRLVEAGEDHVSNLGHSEHARLLEPFRL